MRQYLTHFTFDFPLEGEPYPEAVSPDFSSFSFTPGDITTPSPPALPTSTLPEPVSSKAEAQHDSILEQGDGAFDAPVFKPAGDIHKPGSTVESSVENDFESTESYKNDAPPKSHGKVSMGVK